MDKYSRLFTPGYIGKCRIRNRTVMPPMTLNFSDLNGEPSEKLMAFYEARAKGGIGLIITECFRVNNEHGVLSERQINGTNNRYIPKIIEMTERVHAHGSKIFAQLQHGGSSLSKGLNGGVTYSASNVKGKGAVDEPIPFTIEQIKELEQQFIDAAVRAKLSGMDGVELHGAHRYLIHQFMSAHFNHREDEYGGSYENRARFCTNIIKGIKQACGKDFPVMVRMTGNSFDNYFPGDITLEDALVFAKLLEEAGADALNVSTAVSVSVVSKEEGWHKYLSKAIKEVVNIPVVAINNVKDPDFAEGLLEEGCCDFVALARASLADPEWVKKTRQGRVDEIRRCISCCRCIEEDMPIRKLTRCSVNPELGFESSVSRDRMPVNGNNRPIAVIGGGPAGMEASIVLAKRGFRVTLFEKNDHLGGSAYITTKLADYKDKIAKMLKGLETEMVRAGVKVLLNTEATPELVKEYGPEAVIVACGAKPIIPPVPGINGDNVYLAVDVVDCIAKPVGKTVIIGSGQTGIEAAEKMYQYEPEKDISIVEMMPNIGPGIFFAVLGDELSRLIPHGVKLMPSHKLLAITNEGVKLQNMKEDCEVFVEADSVVLSLGVKPDNETFKAFETAFDTVVEVGDAKAGGRIGDAIWSAYFTCYSFDPDLG